MAIWRMRVACWVPKATNTHSEYVILIALPLQQRWHERTSLRYTYQLCVLLLVTSCIALIFLRFRPNCPVSFDLITVHIPTDKHTINTITVHIPTNKHTINTITVHIPTDKHTINTITVHIPTYKHTFNTITVHIPTDKHTINTVTVHIPTDKQTINNITVQKTTVPLCDLL